MKHLQCAELTGGGLPCRATPGLVVVEADGTARCLTHSRDATRIRRREERNARGGRGRVLTVPADYRRPSFSSRTHVVRFTEELARLVLTGELDPRIVQIVHVTMRPLAAPARGFRRELIEVHCRTEPGERLAAARAAGWVDVTDAPPAPAPPAVA